MADREIIFKVEVQNADGTKSEIDKIAKSVKDFETAISQLEDKVKEADLGSEAYKKASEELKVAQKEFGKAKIATESFGETMSKIPGPLGSVAQGVQGLGTAFKALIANPIVAVFAALAAALVGLFKAFTSTKAGAEQLERVTAGLGAAMDVFRDLILKIAAPLKKLFTDPKKALADFGNALKENVVNRLVGLLELIPNLAGAIGKLFKGDFSGAAKQAGDAVAKVATGVDGFTDKAQKAGKAIKDTFEEAKKEAAEAAKLTGVLQKVEDAERSLRVERAQQNKELAKSKLEIENTNLSTEQRLGALEKVAAAEDNLLQKEIALEKQRLKALRALAALSDTSKEALDELAASEEKLANLEEQSAGKAAELQGKRIALQAEQKAKREEAANAFAEIEDRILQKQQENIVQSIKNEEDRARKALEFQRAAELKEIDQSKATAEQKKKLREEIEKKYQADLGVIKEQEIAKQKEIDDKIAEVLGEARKTEEQKAIDAETQKYDELIKLAGENAEQVKALETAKQEAITKIQIDAAKQRATDLAALESQLRDALAVTEEQQKALQRQKALEETAIYYDELIEAAKKAGLDTTDIEKAKLDKLAEQNRQFEKEDTDLKKAKQKADRELQIGGAINLLGDLASALEGFAGDNVKRQKQAFQAQKAASIAQGIVATYESATKAFNSLASIPVVGPVLGGLAAAAAIAAGLARINTIKNTKFEAKEPEGGGGDGPSPSKFAQGGLLQGKLHAQGGVMTPFGEIEGGEFVVNRNSTANFLPLLEQLNSMGQGQQAGRGNLSAGEETAMMSNQQAPIIKTYVVASDVSSQQEADKRLSDIASL
jgi:hypothetical protein